MRQFIVDAFTEKLFGGNPAAVCVVETFPPAELMQNIATENNFSETAFVMREGDAYRLRWFTPAVEIDFCGHATLATAFVLFNFYAQPSSRAIEFETLSGKFTVERRGTLFEMDLPAYELRRVEVTEAMRAAIHAPIEEAWLARDLIMVLESEEVVERLVPDLDKLSCLEGLTQTVTAAGKEFDCVSRVFAPKLNVPEDPVTGSTHCALIPYWATRLGKERLTARQASKRGGVMHCVVAGERVKISGSAVLYAVADLKV